MPASRSPEDRTLDAQRIRLERGGRLNSLHWFVIGLSAVFALVGWRYSMTMVNDRAQTEFERHVSLVIGLAQDKLERYAIVLDGGASFLAASEHVSLAEWHRYTDSLRLAERVPALRSFAIAYRVPLTEQARFTRERQTFYPHYRIHPRHDGSMVLPISLIWPDHLEPKGIGLDLAREPARRDVLQRTFDTGIPHMTGSVKLGVTGKQGLILFDTFSNEREATSTSQPRDGVAVAVILASELFDGLSTEQGSNVSIRLTDQDGKIHEDEAFASLGSTARLTREHRATVHGRDWVFELRSTPTFDRAAMFWLPTTVLLTGLLINAIVLTLFLGLTRSNRAALGYAARAGRALSREREELAVSNRELSMANTELEAFGHALSHDLRTPLNGIQSLIEFISEDLADIELTSTERENVEDHLQRAQRQVSRGKDLITGMLAYTGLSSGERPSSRVEVREMLDDIADGLRLGPTQFNRPDQLPIMQTCSTRLGQVFANLIGNAVKYHPSVEEAVIEIEACEQGEMVRFAVTDNGCGIEPAYREKVFELFGKAHARSDIESSGIGLSIVKKSIEQVGGTVNIEDATSGGTRVVFTWPHAISKAA